MLTDDDVKKIVAALETSGHPSCRFRELDPEMVSHAVEFYENWNKAFSETKSAARSTIVVLGITGAATVFALGIVAWFKIRITTGN